MSWKEDDQQAYRTSQGMVGRSFRRGVRKGLKAVTGGLFQGDVAGGAAESLATDAAAELPMAVKRSRESKDR